MKSKNKKILIMDNLPFYKSLMIRYLISSSGHRIIYLTSYSTALNPIENLFSQWKDIIKTSNCLNEKILIGNIRSASDQITTTHCNNYYTKMLKCLPKCLNN
ncbi:hypothetical protein DMUE_5494 [Dictyocoela muelleri]|nr:hypothetical protein DMUE_5494 [Dictyocoela muelleri]